MRWDEKCLLELTHHNMFESTEHRNRFREILNCYYTAPFFTKGLCKCMYLGTWDDVHYADLMSIINLITIEGTRSLKTMADEGDAMSEQLTGADAAQWTRERLAQLADKYMGAAANTLDPNEVRQLFRPLGYTGTNAADFREAEALIYDCLLEKMVQKALREGNSDLTVVMGPPASGKSKAVKELDLGGSGLICDGVLAGETPVIG